MTQQIEMGGAWYETMSGAAIAWADAALPDVSVIADHEEADVASSELEAHYWDGTAPDGVNVTAWRAACRKALARRISFLRSGPARVDAA